MTGNNPRLGLVNVNVYAKFGKILSSHSQDNERKQNVGRKEGQNNGTTCTEGQGESSIAPLFQSGATSIAPLFQSGAIIIKSATDAQRRQTI